MGDDGLKLTIKYLEHCDNRPWIIIREGGEYRQHAHLHTKRDAERVRNLIDIGKYPYCEDYKIAMQRLLTEEEFKNLKKKQRYFNSNKGVRF